MYYKYLGDGLDNTSYLDPTNTETLNFEDLSSDIHNAKTIFTELYQPPNNTTSIIQNADGTTTFGKPWIMPINPPPSSFLERPKHIAKLLSLANFGKEYCDVI